MNLQFYEKSITLLLNNLFHVYTVIVLCLMSISVRHSVKYFDLSKQVNIERQKQLSL